MSDLIWRETAPGVEEADLNGARFVVRDRYGRGGCEHDVVVFLPGGERLEDCDHSLESARSLCNALASWAASCGAARDRARGEVGR